MHRARRVLETDVTDAERAQRFDVGSGCGYADDVETGLLERDELWTEQQREADVGRRHMGHQRSGHALAPRYRTRLASRRTSSSKRIPPRTLCRKNSRPSARCTGERAKRQGSVAPYRFGRVPASAAEMNS